MNWANLSGLAMLWNRFTVSLFIAGLSYELGSDMLNDARIGDHFRFCGFRNCGLLHLENDFKENSTRD